MQTQMRTDAEFDSVPGQFDADTSARTQSIYQSHHAVGAVPQSLNRAILVTLFGTINVDQLVLSLNECARKHDSLRAHLRNGGEQWLISSDVELPFRFIKGQADQVEATEARLIKSVEDSMTRTIDLHDGPLWQATLFQLEPNTYVLLLTCHAIVGDTNTLAVLAHDVAENYQLFSDAARPEISVLEHGLDNTPSTAARSIEYWLEQQNRGVVTSQLPDMHEGRPKTFEAARVDLVIAEKSRQSLISLARRHQCELHDVLVCALAILVKRLDPSRPVAVHCQTQLGPGQLRTDQIAMSVPFDIDLNLTGSETLETVTQALAESRKHAVFDAKKLKKTTSRHDCQPIAISFSLVSSPSKKTLNFGQAQGEMMTVRAAKTTVPFGLSVLDDGETLRLECEYQTESFDDQTVVNWIGAYRALLIALARESRLPAGVLEILDPRHEALIEGFSDGQTTQTLAREQVGEHLSQLAAQRKDQIAIESDSRRLSWEDCESMSNQIARHMINSGIRPGQAVAVQLNDSIQSTVAAIACLKAQVPFVNMPVNLAPQVQSKVCETVDAQLLMTSSALPISTDWQQKTVIKLDVDHEKIASQSAAALSSPDTATTHPTAWYEVGTNQMGDPICVPVTWRAIGNLLSHGSDALGINADDRVICLSNPNAGADLAGALATLSTGATVLQPTASAAASGAALYQFVVNTRASAMIASPVTWQQMANAKSIPVSLKAIVHGVGLTDVLAEELLSDSRTVRRTIGSAETGFISVAGDIESVKDRATVGTAQPNTVLRILDERAQPCPIGAVGELLVGGACVSGRYVDAALLSSQQFVLDQFGSTPENHLFRTGIACAWRSNGSIRVIDEKQTAT